MELKRVLIISPYFPPSNAADMQRIRMSLPYFHLFHWESEIVTVDPIYSDMVKDELLLQSVPGNVTVHLVKAFDKAVTARLGLGSIALRSLWFYKKKVDQILKQSRFDLIYFSTTQFPVCILGARWKRKFGVPYVIDMQDPWHSEYYRSKPKKEQPSKYWFSYRLNKYLEPLAIKKCSGLISVSEVYINHLRIRYPQIENIPAATITFGAFEPDLKIAEDNRKAFGNLLDPDFRNIVYIGRGGVDMHKAVSAMFASVKNFLDTEPLASKKIKFYFIGTSYASSGKGKPTILPLAKQFGIDDHVIEITDRISYYHTLLTLQQADALFVPGSDDPGYTASKIYPYLLTRKPLLTIFNSKSSAVDVLNEYGVDHNYTYDNTENLAEKIKLFLKQVLDGRNKFVVYNSNAEKKYSAQNMTQRQCDFFETVLKEGNGKN